MPEIFILMGLVFVGIVIGGLVLYGVLYAAAHRFFRHPPPPANNEPSSDLSEYRHFMAEQPTIEEIREQALPTNFDEAVRQQRNKPE